MSKTVRFFRFLAALALAVLAVPLLAQTTFPIEGYIYPIEGYICAVHPPRGYDADGRRFDISSKTSFGLMGSDSTSTASPLKESLRVGVYVQVAGPVPDPFSAIKATTVLIRDDWNQMISGTGVITRVISPAPMALFEADGYLIRITPSTKVAFLGGLNSLAEVSTNSWLNFSGKRGRDGILEATKAQFIPAKPTKFKDPEGLEIDPVKTRPAGVKDRAMTSEGMGSPAISGDGATLQQDEQIKIGLGSWHTLPADQPLQQRVRRIGMALVPPYQRAMADDNPSKIHFRFFAVDNKKWRSAICLLDGAVLVPKQTIERLGNEDQLAAVVADGIACNLQRQTARRVMAIRKELGIDIATAWLPVLDLVAAVGVDKATRAGKAVMREERLRIALALMRDAGYDPWQAPEAWRFLDPKELPANLALLPYPDTSCYQIGILNLQYQAPNAAIVSGEAQQTSEAVERK